MLVRFFLEKQAAYDYGTVLTSLAVTFCFQRQQIDMCSEGVLACRIGDKVSVFPFASSGLPGPFL